MIEKNNSKLSGIVGIVGIVLGIGLLVLAKYMLTNYAYSVSQTHKSHAVHDLGLLILLIGIVALIMYVLRVSTKQARKQK
jgi:heme/copper-type cytochrome/quinol oxidase subunit 2